jgi:hypothetical protein
MITPNKLLQKTLMNDVSISFGATKTHAKTPKTLHAMWDICTRTSAIHDHHELSKSCDAVHSTNIDMEVSINGGSPKRMAYNGKSY